MSVSSEPVTARHTPSPSPVLLTSALLLACGALIARQLALPVAQGFAGAVLLILALLPWLLSAAAGAAVNRLCVMIAGALLGWLAGLWMELGSYGLTILASWCSTTTQTGVQAAWSKLQMLPGSHLGMLAGGLLGMALAADWTDAARTRRCCLLALPIMPLAAIAADLLIFAFRPGVNAPMTASMLVVMVGAMALAGLFIYQLECLLYRHASPSAPS